MFPTSETKIKNIDHLGIVAGLIDEIGIIVSESSPKGKHNHANECQRLAVRVASPFA